MIPIILLIITNIFILRKVNENKNLNIIFLIVCTLLIVTNTFAKEQFNFDITNIEITEKGNLIKGLNKGIIKTDNGVTIISESFVYNKIQNILTASGGVEIFDSKKYIKLFANSIIYKKN